MSRKSPQLAVGVLSATDITVHFHGTYVRSDGSQVTGKRIFTVADIGEEFFPEREEASFTIENVVIGIDFHWEQKESQTFPGALKIAQNPDRSDEIFAINLVETEHYLMSVISSEMRGTASLPLLKAHAIISRSWVLAQIGGYKMAEGSVTPASDTALTWYDKDDHTIFDVCADDHCQRYQGFTRDVTEKARRAVEETRGEVLTSEGGLVDARFHKCCGGILEKFETCWEDVTYDYLLPVRDHRSGGLADVSDEKAATDFILSRPASFCHTQEEQILSQVLNTYDQSTTDFYRWSVTYEAEELGKIIHKRTGKNLGRVLALTPIHRGPSGRLYQLEVRGTEGTLTLGKELEIRRALSESHLYSSAFVVEEEIGTDGTPARFTLHGAGWGHGVGLCQIGAAVMGATGYSHDEILHHYYPNTEITKIY